MTIKKYLEDSALQGKVKITEKIEGDMPIIRLEETWFHAQGGGQKADRGTIGPAKVTHVAHNDGTIDHYVDSVENIETGKTYEFSIDEEWRSLNSRYHSAGHLIAAIVEDLYPNMTAISGHQWPGEARVEFTYENTCPELEEAKSRLQDGLKQHFDQNTAVRIVGDPYKNRSMQIAGFTAIPCGGTHISSVAEIGTIEIGNIKCKKEKVRVSYALV